MAKVIVVSIGEQPGPLQVIKGVQEKRRVTKPEHVRKLQDLMARLPGFRFPNMFQIDEFLRHGIMPPKAVAALEAQNSSASILAS